MVAVALAATAPLASPASSPFAGEPADAAGDVASATAASTSGVPAVASTPGGSAPSATGGVASVASVAANARTTAGATASGAAADPNGPEIVERVTYRQLDDGTLEATVAFDVPETMTAFEFRFAMDYHDVVAVDGFERTGGGSLSWDDGGTTFAWDGETAAPSVVLRHDPTVGKPASYAGGTDDWAVVLRPPTRARWRYADAEPTYEYDAAVEGEGVAGERFLALGEHEVHERGAAGERIRLVVPDAAELASPRERVLASLATASERLRVGERSDVVTVFAAPTAVPWEHRGLSLGPDARVAADQPVARSPNLWIHEYVHTRQDRDATTRETSWLVEATAEYYAASVPLARGDVDYATYRRSLVDGASVPRRGSVLARPSTWRGQAQYHKGSLVVAALDRELRAASGGEATFQDVVRAWNDAGRFDGDDLSARLAALGGERARTFGVRHVRTNATPSLANRSRHEAVFERDLDGGGRLGTASGVVGDARTGGPTGGASGVASGSDAAPGSDALSATGAAGSLVDALQRFVGGTASQLRGSLASTRAVASASAAWVSKPASGPLGDLLVLGALGSVAAIGGVGVRS